MFETTLVLPTSIIETNKDKDFNIEVLKVLFKHGYDWSSAGVKGKLAYIDDAFSYQVNYNENYGITYIPVPNWKGCKRNCKYFNKDSFKEFCNLIKKYKRKMPKQPKWKAIWKEK